MIRIKPLFAIQTKNKNRWEMTEWAKKGSEKEAHEGLKEAERAYPREEYRMIKIHRRYEIVS